jgi:hypothetical protein
MMWRLVRAGLHDGVVAGIAGGVLALAVGLIADVLATEVRSEVPLMGFLYNAFLWASMGISGGAVRAAILGPPRRLGAPRRPLDAFVLRGVAVCCGLVAALCLLGGAVERADSYRGFELGEALGVGLAFTVFFLPLGALVGGLFGSLAATWRDRPDRRTALSAQERLQAQLGLSRLDVVLCAVYASALAWLPLTVIFAVGLLELAENLLDAISPLSVDTKHVAVMLVGSVTLATFLALAGWALRTPPRRYLPDKHKVLVGAAGMFSGVCWVPFGLFLVLAN